MAKGIIFLLPSPVSDIPPLEVIPDSVTEIIGKVNVFWVENVRTTRRYFSRLGIRNIDKLDFRELNKHTDPKEIETLLTPVEEGQSAAILSEAGCPGIADPGSQAIQLAHKKGVQVIPIPGPSSIFLALMASGFNGQGFTFHGYLPIDKKNRKNKIRNIQDQAFRYGHTQIFMETPYRNNQLMSSLLQVLDANALLCIASDITGKEEYIRTRQVKEWIGHNPDLHKKPTIFLLSRP